MNEYKSLYKSRTSKNYKRLFKLINQGYEVACFVDYNYVGSDFPPTRDICKARLNGERISFSARGIEYGAYRNGKDFESFREDCERMNVEFIGA